MEAKKGEKTRPPRGCLMRKRLAPVWVDSWETPFVSEQDIKHVTADLREAKEKSLCVLALKFTLK